MIIIYISISIINTTITWQEADLALGPFVGTPSRESIADLTSNFYYDSYSVLSQRPVASSDPAGIVKTFTPQVHSRKKY